MADQNPVPYDVIIAGAGPVGLFLACELRLAGLTVLILERAKDPHTELKQLPFGLRGLSAITIEALDRRGLLEDLVAAQRAGDVAGTAHWSRQTNRPGGHFAGIQFQLDDVDTAQWPYRLPGPAGTSLAVTMDALETVLAARASAMGADIRRGLALESFEATDEGVTVRAGGHSFVGRWLVGCDGGRSIVRKLGGFEFVGTEPEFTGYSAEVELANPGLLSPGRHYTAAGMYTYSPPGTIAVVEFDAGICHRTAQLTRDHVQAALRRVTGIDLTLSALHLATTWTDRAYQATAYRNGRVFLAGDAAHVHSPLGGQGLNLGLGDAMNLGWKLAATIRGDAPPDLLDSYCRERHPVGAQILDWSRAQVAIIRPAPSSRALEAILRDLIATRDGATYFAGRIWGLALRYDLGDDHPLVGRSVPDFEFADGRRVGALMRNGKGLLLDFEPDAPLRGIAARWRSRLTYAQGDVANRLGLNALLARPDGVVIWLSENGPANADAARAALRWLGEPEPTEP